MIKKNIFISLLLKILLIDCLLDNNKNPYIIYINMLYIIY